MARHWKQVKEELEKKTAEIWLECPDEIKRFHYGIITHSDAGKHSFDQYFGHWVHAYAGYYGWGNEIGVMMGMTMDPEVDLKMIKKIFKAFIVSISPFFAEYAGQHIQAKATTDVYEAMDTVENKQEMVQLLQAYHILITRLYWWIHWYFPWGIGPSLCHRLSPEDVREIVRLSKT